MKALIAILVVLFAGKLFATEVKEVNFYYGSMKSYYACSYAEYQAKMFLTKLGARNVVTDCSGGIDISHPEQPIDMKVTFEQYASEGTAVTLRGNESCDFNVKLIDALLTKVDHKDLKKQESCWDSQGSFKYDVSL